MKKIFVEYFNFIRKEISLKCILTILIVFFALSINAQPQWVIYTTSNSGLPGNSVGTILIDSNNVKWVTTNNGFARLKGNSWTVYDTTNSGIPSNQCELVIQDKQNNMWITITDKGVVKFDGINWTVYNDENTGYGIHSNTSICIDNQNTKWVSYAGGLLRYNDTVWTRYHTGNSGIPSNGVLRLFSEGNIIWVGTVDAGAGRFDGQNWTTFNVSNSGLPSNWIYRMTKDMNNNIWFATRFGGAAKFNYTQNLWTVYNTGNSGIPDNTISVVYIDNNNVKWIGSYGCAIFNDTSWQVFPYSFIGYVYDFAKDRYGNMWICTGGGLYVYNPAGVVGVENNITVVPSKYSLSQNYPNPFNSMCNVQFSMCNAGNAKLVVYDVMGREVQTLVNEMLKPGTYEISFDGSKLPSGVYFYKLEVNGFTQTRRMVMTK